MSEEVTDIEKMFNCVDRLGRYMKAGDVVQVFWGLNDGSRWSISRVEYGDSEFLTHLTLKHIAGTGELKDNFPTPVWLDSVCKKDCFRVIRHRDWEHLTDEQIIEVAKYL